MTIRAIAFYLPQFHPIQADIGFYDLRVPETRPCSIASRPRCGSRAATPSTRWVPTRSGATSSRLLYGARVSLVVGFSAVVVAGVLGVTLGLLSGWYRGRLDDLLMRLGDVQLACPVLVLAVAVLAVLGASLTNLIVVLGVTGWITYPPDRARRGAHPARARVRDGAQAMGAPDGWILRRHLLLNVPPNHRRGHVLGLQG